MTLEEIRSSDKLFLSPLDVSTVLGCNPHTLSMTAREQPERIGFPYTFSGNRMKIPRKPFLQFLGVGE